MPLGVMILRNFVCLFVWVCGSWIVWAQGEVPMHDIPQLQTGTPEIDGHLNEPFWESALHLELAYEVRPGENIDPPVRTELMMIYNNSQALLDDQQQYDLTRKDRTFFVKFGYAWTR